MTTNTIRWTDRERNTVTRRYAELVFSGRKEGIATFRVAQQEVLSEGMLSKDRERELASMQSVGSWFPPLFRELLGQIQQEAQEQALADDAEGQEEIVEAQPNVDLSSTSTDNLLAELMRRALGIVLSDPTFIAPVVGQVAEQLKPSLVSAVQTEILNALPSMVKTAANSIGVPASVTSTRPCVPAVKKRKIVIIGLKGGQPQQVKQKIPEDFVLTFYESRVPASQLKATLKHTDHVFFMSDWNNHATQSVVKNSNVPFEYVPGTVTNLVRRISEFAAS